MSADFVLQVDIVGKAPHLVHGVHLRSIRYLVHQVVWVVVRSDIVISYLICFYKYLIKSRKIIRIYFCEQIPDSILYAIINILIIQGLHSSFAQPANPYAALIFSQAKIRNRIGLILSMHVKARIRRPHLSMCCCEILNIEPHKDSFIFSL